MGLALPVAAAAILLAGVGGALAIQVRTGWPSSPALSVAAWLGLAVVVAVGIAGVERLRRWSAVDPTARAPLDRAREELLLDVVDVGLLEVDHVAGHVTLSSGAARLLGVERGVPPEPIPFEVAFRAVRISDRVPFRQALDAHGAPGATRRMVWRFRRMQPDGGPRTLEAQVRVLLDDEGRPDRGLCALRDVTTADVLDRARAAWSSALEAEVAVRTAEAQRRARQARALSVELSRSEHLERQRIASVLHDGLQQTLAAARFRLRALEHAQDVKAAAREVDGLVVEAIDDARGLAAALDPPVNPDEDLAGAIAWMVGRFEDRHGLETELTVGSGIQGSPLREQHGTTLLGAARELLFNAVKYADGESIELILERRDGQHRVVVRDRGPGLSGSATPEAGVGLAHVRRRLDGLGGGLSLQDRAEGGAEAIAWLPARLGGV